MEPVPIDQCSVITFHRTETQKIRKEMMGVLKKLPLQWIYSENGKVRRYCYKFGKCDGNTAHNLEKIVMALLDLYPPN